MGTDTSKLYSQHLALNIKNNYNTPLSPRPHSHLPNLTRNISDISLATPQRSKIEQGFKGSHINPFFINNSYITSNPTKDLGTRNNLQRSRSVLVMNPLSYSQVTTNYYPKQSRITPSILKKQIQKGFPKTLKIDPYHEEIDIIRVSLRSSKDKILGQMKPMIQNEIGQMNQRLQSEKASKTNNKNQILFILAQRNHYQNLVQKLNEYEEKIDKIINQLRRNDIVAPKTVQQMKITKDSIHKLLSNVQKDLPNKSWKIVLQQPQSKLYQLVVSKASKNEDIKKQFFDLQKNDLNSDNNSSLNGSMLFSNTYRLGSPHPILQNSTNNFKNTSNISNTISQSTNNVSNNKLEFSQDIFSLGKKNSGIQNANSYQTKNQQPMRQTRYPFGQLNKL